MFVPGLGFTVPKTRETFVASVRGGLSKSVFDHTAAVARSVEVGGLVLSSAMESTGNNCSGYCSKVLVDVAFV